MIVPARPALARACQLARSGACSSLEEIRNRLSDEQADCGNLLEDVDVRRMLRGLMRQAVVIRSGRTDEGASPAA